MGCFRRPELGRARSVPLRPRSPPSPPPPFYDPCAAGIRRFGSPGREMDDQEEEIEEMRERIEKLEAAQAN